MQIPPVGYPYNIPPGDYPKSQNNYGWICTSCGKSNAPWVSCCNCIEVPITLSKDTYTHVPVQDKPIYEKPIIFSKIISDIIE